MIRLVQTQLELDRGRTKPKVTCDKEVAERLQDMLRILKLERLELEFWIRMQSEAPTEKLAMEYQKKIDEQHELLARGHFIFGIAAAVAEKVRKLRHTINN